MIPDTSELTWPGSFPALAASRDAAIVRLRQVTRTVCLGAGQIAFVAGTPARQYLLVTSGTVRVQFTTPAGREVVLYHVGPGDSCVLTTSCLLGSVPYPADGIAESDAAALAVDARDFEQALQESADFRRFVFANLGLRFAEVLGRMTDVAFGQLERRLARTLFDASSAGGPMVLTHQALATELGTVREVVSRRLKGFERRGWVRLGRGSIEVLDRSALQQLADTDEADGPQP